MSKGLHPKNVLMFQKNYSGKVLYFPFCFHFMSDLFIHTISFFNTKFFYWSCILLVNNNIIQKS